MKLDTNKIDEEICELIDENDLNYCRKQILKQTIEHPETAHKQACKLEKYKKNQKVVKKNTVNYTDPETGKKSKQRTSHATRIQQTKWSLTTKQE